MSLTADELRQVDDYLERWWQAAHARTDFPAPPISLLQRAALEHPSGKVQKFALNILDHEANDESSDVFRAALADPTPSVRREALHGFACNRCRVGELCLDDVVPAIIDVLEHDENANVRHASLFPLVAVAAGDPRAQAAFARAAESDPDELIRYAAAAARDGNYREVTSRKALRRRQAQVGVRTLVE